MQGGTVLYEYAVLVTTLEDEIFTYWKEKIVLNN